MSNKKTCGECQWYDDQHLLCIVGGDVEPTDCACDNFIPIKPTNGDVIRQMCNEVMWEHFHLFIDCPDCPVVDMCKTMADCKKNLLAWLDAPAEKGGEK